MGWSRQKLDVGTLVRRAVIIIQVKNIEERKRERGKAGSEAAGVGV